MRRFAGFAISSGREWNDLQCEVNKLKSELKRTQQENADLQAKLKAYETGCIYGGAHCEACKKSRKVSGCVLYGMMGYKEHSHICTLAVPCGEFEPKEADQ